MTEKAKTTPKAWLTWVAKYMAGETQCQFALWYRSHFYYEKQESRGFDLDNWIAAHNALLRDRKAALEALGMTVLIEEQNAFSLQGSSGAVVSGKPDLVAFTPDGEEFWVEDMKTGRPKTSDHMQVGLGMLLLPHTMPDKCRGLKARGNVVYKTAIVKVLPIDRQLFTSTVAVLGGPDEPAKTPSYDECKYCDVACCKDRVTEKPKETSCDWF